MTSYVHKRDLNRHQRTTHELLDNDCVPMVGPLLAMRIQTVPDLLSGYTIPIIPTEPSDQAPPAPSTSSLRACQPDMQQKQAYTTLEPKKKHPRLYTSKKITNLEDTLLITRAAGQPLKITIKLPWEKKAIVLTCKYATTTRNADAMVAVTNQKVTVTSNNTPHDRYRATFLP